MKHRALIVEDDPDIAESIIERVESLGHDHVWVKSQDEARQHLCSGVASGGGSGCTSGGEGISYVLLDLQIPMRAGRGLPSIEYGLQLAAEIHRSQIMRNVPIVAMSAYGSDGFGIAGRLFEHGVMECINKPFPTTGRTLAFVIESVLKRVYGAVPSHAGPPKVEQPFMGGEMVFFADRVELCGITVATTGRSRQIWAILKSLDHKLSNGRYRPRSARELAAEVGRNVGQGSIAGSIRDFRLSVAETLKRDLGLVADRKDVIESNGGYRLKSWITTKDMRLSRSDEAYAADARANAGLPDHMVARREEILRLLRDGERLRVPDLAERLRCSTKTVARILADMKCKGQVEFVGPSRSGCYCLANSRSEVTAHR